MLRASDIPLAVLWAVLYIMLRQYILLLYNMIQVSGWHPKGMKDTPGNIRKLSGEWSEPLGPPEIMMGIIKHNCQCNGIIQEIHERIQRNTKNDW